MGRVVEPVKIQGLRDFRRALKEMDAELPRQIRVALNKAAEVVADDARAKVPRRSGRAAASVKAASGQQEARVKGGSARAPYYGWLEFGGRIGRNKTGRKWVSGGRYIYPAFGRHRDDVIRIMDESLTELARSAGVEVS